MTLLLGLAWLVVAALAYPTLCARYPLMVARAVVAGPLLVGAVSLWFALDGVFASTA